MKRPEGFATLVPHAAVDKKNLPPGTRKESARLARINLRAARRARRIRERQELRRFTRSQRRRRFIVWGSLVLVLVLAGGSFALASSPLFALRQVLAEGEQKLDPEQIIAAAADQLGSPLAFFDEEKLAKNLADILLVRSFTTEIVPPNTMIVRIVERVPLGVIQRADGFVTVDAEGVSLEVNIDRPEGYPLIDTDRVSPDSSAFRSLVQVVEALPLSLRADLELVRASSRDNVTLVFSGSGQRALWGAAEGSERKAQVLAALVAIHGQDGSGRYDVSAPGTAVFRPD